MSQLIDAIFSKSTKAILVAVFSRPDGIHLRALMALTGLASASAQRELGKLTSAGLLLKEETGTLVLYKSNKNSPIFKELEAIIRKTSGVAQLIRDSLRPFHHRMERAFIYGSVARAEDAAGSDIDLMVIGEEIGSADLYPALVAAEKNLARKISLTVYRPLEYRRKLAAKNHFLVTVMSGPTIELVDDQNEQKGTR